MAVCRIQKGRVRGVLGGAIFQGAPWRGALRCRVFQGRELGILFCVLAFCPAEFGPRLWSAGGKAKEEERKVEHPATDHWAFRPLRQRESRPLRQRESRPLERKGQARTASPIDAFVYDTLRGKGLAPSPATDRRRLIRRLYLVLHGIPPTPDEIARFVSDTDALAYENLVDRALDSPRYGERWAQHWLDVIRFAETNGFEVNKARPRAYPYRDWVIRALNEDMPYDRFILEQLAGDAVGVDAATGFLVAGPANLPGQVGENIEARREARQDELNEIIKSTSQAFLGLTTGCARCHDHKFDPILQKDYYALQAVFAGVYYGERRLHGAENDRWASQVPEIERQVSSLRTRLEEARLRWGLRPPVNGKLTEERFDAVETRSVRMEIAAMNSDSYPALHEFQVWTVEQPGQPPENVALAARGGRASASSFALVNQTRHPENLINEKDEFPWAAAEKGSAWLQIDLPGAFVIDRISWRGTGGGYPADYDIKVRRLGGEWRLVAHSRDRLPGVEDRRAAKDVRLEGVPPDSVDPLVEVNAEIREKDKEFRRLAAGPQVYAGKFKKPEPTYLLHRGDVMRREAVVIPDILGALGRLGLAEDAGHQTRRVALAQYLTGPAAPLTARVMVNRLWQHHFGMGIVDTPSDFGRMGSRPTHPELLDWLATEFISSGWSMKHIHRLILLSDTFRQKSEPRAEALAVDADSRFLWRFPPRRLEAEALRDSILHASGKLNLKMYGTGFDFFEQRGGVESFEPKPAASPSEWRRMIYATKIRMETGHVFGVFDCPDAGQMAPRRSRSITPVQALNLFNSQFVTAQADFLAERVRLKAGTGALEQEEVEYAVALALGRSPDAVEVEQLTQLSKEHGLEQVCRVLLNTNEFVFLQ